MIMKNLIYNNRGLPREGLKLSFLLRHQVATEIFFSVTRWKILVVSKCP